MRCTADTWSVCISYFPHSWAIASWFALVDPCWKMPEQVRWINLAVTDNLIVCPNIHWVKWGCLLCLYEGITHKPSTIIIYIQVELSCSWYNYDLVLIIISTYCAQTVTFWSYTCVEASWLRRVRSYVDVWLWEEAASCQNREGCRPGTTGQGEPQSIHQSPLPQTHPVSLLS